MGTIVNQYFLNLYSNNNIFGYLFSYNYKKQENGEYLPEVYWGLNTNQSTNQLILRFLCVMTNIPFSISF